MPIQGRNPKEVFDFFEAHVAKVFRETLPVPAHIYIKWTGKPQKELALLEFVNRGNGLTASLPIDTDHGRLFLTLRQHLEAARTDRHYELKTVGYSYRLINDPHPTVKARIRWEYSGDTPAAHAYCRHHVQIAGGVELIEPVLFDLDRSHTPTGWVTFEEIIRFLIYELKTKHLNDDWPGILAESERTFYEEFTTRRYRWQGFKILRRG